MSKKVAYLFEARGIQRFLFSTGRLKDMLVGSDLIDYICAENGLLDHALCSLGFDSQVKSPRRAGGAFYLIFDNLNDAQRFQSVWRLIMSQWFPTLEIVDTITQDTSVKESIAKGINNLHIARNRIRITLPNASPITQRCNRTGLAVARNIYTHDNKKEPIDASTYILRNFDRPANSGSVISRFVAETNNDTKIFFPNNFEADAKDNKRFPLNSDSMIGLIHADGNGLGEVLRVLNVACSNADDDTYIELYRAFSQGMTQATITATQNASKSILLPNLAKNNVLPARPLVLGGDDLSVIVRADLAIDFTEVFILEFARQSAIELNKLRQIFEQHDIDINVINNLPTYLTACAGIVFIKSSQPFHQAYELAESLCKKAKSYSRAHLDLVTDNTIPASLAFYQVKDSTLTDIDLIIANNLTVNHQDATYHLSLPAYFVDSSKFSEDSGKKLATVKQLKELVNFLLNSDFNENFLRSFATTIHDSLPKAKKDYKRWLEFSSKEKVRVHTIHQKQQLENITEFHEMLGNMIGELEESLPFTKTDTTYQSALADILTLLKIIKKNTDK
ncbi:hypothetical protein [Psychrobacter sp. I-STPA6b]|uniref:hypothetical protein n=1 Tax=Psychrobacter sp. I-STPA6b TaxID=2585718 RepID=UPI001D0C17DF|nr:hypothetical protein [Psychrobacter sp. I-STPA6b]